jgi:uncharacterized protein (TIGR03437 family)
VNRLAKIAFFIVPLLVAGAASAQTYTFSSCQKSVSLTVKINMTVSTSGPFSDGQGGHQTTVIFFGDFVLTVNGATQTYSNVVGTGSIYYSVTLDHLTTFGLQVAPGGPVSLQATLQGAGDLIPNGVFGQALPPLAQWTAPSLGMTHDYIAYGNPTVFYPMDSFNNCTAAGPGTVTISLVISAGAYGGFKAIAPGTWIEIYGSGLAPGTRPWAASDFKGQNAPTALDGVRVKINGENAFISYISPGQINAQVPSDVPTGGTLQITVSNNGVTTNPYDVMVNGVEPGLLAPASFNIGAKQYVVALLPDYATYILPTGAVAGLSSRPAKPGETIILYGIGFGLVTPPSPAGVIEETSTNRLILPVQISIGGVSAQVAYAGLATPYVGLYQFDVVVPPVPDNALVPITVTVAGVAGTQTLYTAVHQ